HRSDALPIRVEAYGIANAGPRHLREDVARSIFLQHPHDLFIGMEGAIPPQGRRLRDRVADEVDAREEGSTPALHNASMPSPSSVSRTPQHAMTGVAPAAGMCARSVSRPIACGHTTPMPPHSRDARCSVWYWRTRSSQRRETQHLAAACQSESTMSCN